MSSLRIRVPFWSAAALAAGIVGIAVWHGPLFGAEAPVVIDPPSVDNPKAAVAEDYHQDYLIHNPSAPYIAMFDMPKIENFKRIFPELYSGRPVSARNGFRP